MRCPHCGEWIETHTRANDHATSEAAAAKMRITAENTRGRVLLAMLAADRPMTDEDIDAALRKGDEPESSYRRRRTDLAQMGLVEDTGKVKLNSKGNPSILWGLNLAGLMEAARISP